MLLIYYIWQYITAVQVMNQSMNEWMKFGHNFWNDKERVLSKLKNS